MWILMNFKSYAVNTIATVLGGVMLGWVACEAWEHSYKEARDAGVVADR